MKLVLRFISAEVVDVEILDGVSSSSPRTISLPEPDPSRALEQLRKLNTLTTDEGVFLSSLLSIDGYEPWWFIQEHLLWHILVPLTRYEELLELCLQAEDITLWEAPSSFTRLLQGLLPKVTVTTFPENEPELFSRLKTRLSTLVLFLVSVVSIILYVLRRPTFIVYSIDKPSTNAPYDFRISELYDYLLSRHIRFIEILHVSSLRESLRNLLEHFRPALYLEPVISWPAKLHRNEHQRPPHKLPAVSPLLAAVINYALTTTEQAAARYTSAKRIIAAIKPAALLALDDSRHAYPLVAAAKALGVVTVGLQHGLTTNEYFAGHACFGFRNARSHAYDWYFLWSEYFRNRVKQISAIYNDTNTKVCGPLRHNYSFSLRSPYHPLHVLIIEENQLPNNELDTFVAPLAVDHRIRVAVKHRDSAAEDSGFESLDHAFAWADVVVGAYSSVLYEAVRANIPVVVVPSKHHLSAKHLADDGFADLFSEPGTAAETVIAAAKTSEQERARRRILMWGERSQGRGVQTVFDFLASLDSLTAPNSTIISTQ